MRDIEYQVKVHGNSLLLEYPGPGVMRNVQNVDWSDQQGLRRGGGVTFRGQPNRDNYFHVVFPTFDGLPLYNPYLQELYHGGTVWHSATLYFQPTGPADIFHIGFFDGSERFYDLTQRPRIDVRPGLPIRLPAPHRNRLARIGFGLSIGVHFGEPDSQIWFQGVAAGFAVQFWEPTDPNP